MGHVSRIVAAWRRAALGCALAVCAVQAAPAAFAWGSSGHKWASGLAAERFPEELPAFLRTPEAARDIQELGVELDRSKGAGDPHDAERNPGHYIDLFDDGSAGGLSLSPLPPTREAFDTALRALPKPWTQYKMGYLPYAMLDGWQQIVKDFAYWRAASIGEKSAATEEDRAWFAQDRRLREMLIIRDIGVWSHYVGDATQPMHVSIHFNGWGDFPNPENFTQDKDIHARFEGWFVRNYVTRAMVAQTIPDYRDCGCAIQDRVMGFLQASRALIDDVYRLEKTGVFNQETNVDRAAGVAFVSYRLGAAAAEMRDQVVMAWRASADATVGFPVVAVRDIESGKVVLTRQMMGAD